MAFAGTTDPARTTKAMTASMTLRIFMKTPRFDGPDDCGTPVIEAYMVNQYRNKKFSSPI